jgi:hypothetical protein
MRLFQNDPEDVTPEEILEWCDAVAKAEEERVPGRPLPKVGHRLSLQLQTQVERNE